MGLGTNHVTTTTAAEFIPELWSDEVVASYKKNLVMANLVTKLNHRGKKGDTIYVPVPTRGLASAKAASTQVTLIAATETKKTYTIDKHYEYSRLIEDIVDVQALPSLRKFYTDDAGYALARQVDFNLMVLGTGLDGGTLDASPGTPDASTLTYTTSVARIGSTGAKSWDPTANTNAGNGTALADLGIRTMMQYLDDSDTPMDGRVIVIPPVEKKTLLGLDHFVLWTNVGEAASANSLRTGKIGDIYGMSVYVSTACGSTLAADGTTAYRAGLLFHPDALVHIEQMGVRSQTQYKQEYLSDLFTADTIYGVGELRDTAGVAFIVPA